MKKNTEFLQTPFSKTRYFAHERHLRSLDERFVSKVYRTIVYTWALAMVWAMVFRDFWIALSLTFGMLVGTGVLAGYDLAIRKILTPGATKAGRALGLLIIAKYFLVTIAIFWLVKWERISPFGFFIGVVLTHFAMFAKLAGIKIQERQR